MTIKNLGKLSQQELDLTKAWLKRIDPLMQISPSTYAKGRREISLRNTVELVSAKSGKPSKIEPISPQRRLILKSEQVELIGERLLPKFDQALILHYPAGTEIKKHADSPAYAKGAASINVIGEAIFNLYSWGDEKFLESINLTEGDCISFDNKQPHSVSPVQFDRWCICFFYLKELQAPAQLSLF
ncbi:hypothetical protein VB713_20485 [Anabaena cylindrica UHCC 0172]|uniref:hypothetical protein n=1 Tax=Anabaena cylindrica TaxID=1165 RepID=UPI002B215454|nr:hypothetical protein [Anabaena cylindrica]MEA5553320.1 hypothetical protein [Anabaena cylindrica UHCC 0172]